MCYRRLEVFMRKVVLLSILCLVAPVDKAAKGARSDDDGEPEDEKRGSAEARSGPAAEGGERPAAQANGAC